MIASRTHRRLLAASAALTLTGMSLAGCAPEPPPSGPVSPLLGTITSNVGDQMVLVESPRICSGVGSYVKVEAFNNLHSVQVQLILDSSGSNNYARSEFSGSTQSAVFRSPEQCWKLSASYVDFSTPAGLNGDSVGYRITWPTATPTSPQAGTLEAGTSLYQSTYFSPEMCTGAGVKVRIDVTDNEYAATVKLMTPTDLTLTGATTFGTGGGTATFTTTEACWSAFVTHASFTGLNGNSLNYVITWPVP